MANDEVVPTPDLVKQHAAKLQAAMVTIRKWGSPRNKVRVELDDKGNVAEFYSHDEYGLALDPKFWCKTDCSNCHGQGTIWLLVQKNGKPHREMNPCPRAKRRYNTKRIEVEERLHRARNRGGEVAECRELERIHRENGHGIRITKSPTNLATPSGEDDVAKDDVATQRSTAIAT